MTTATIMVKTQIGWVTKYIEHDGYPNMQMFGRLASAFSDASAVRCVGVERKKPSAKWDDFTYRWDGAKKRFVFRAGRRGKWKPLRAAIFRDHLKFVQNRVRAINAGTGCDNNDEWQLTYKFMTLYGVLPWEVVIDRETRRYILDEDGKPMLAHAGLAVHLKPGVSLKVAPESLRRDYGVFE